MKKRAFVGIGFFAAFAVWTVLVRLVDVQPIGPLCSRVGLATVNGFVHRLTGANMALYTATDWLGLVPIATALGFAALGLWQWLKRKRLLAVDRDLFALGGFYLAVIAVYTFFEVVVINQRPVLINGVLEASYPSSTTMLVLCVMPTAAMQLRRRIKRSLPRRCVMILITAFTAFMVVVGRLLSGVHWVTDIVGGLLVSCALVAIYSGLSMGSFHQK